MQRVVLDTNILLALWIFNDPSVAPLQEALDRGQLVAVRSAATDGEIREVLARPGLFTVTPERQTSLLADWAARSTFIEATTPVAFQCRDPLDQKFLELAVAAGARWLVTRDKKLLKLRRKTRVLGLGIVTPQEFAVEWTSLRDSVAGRPGAAAVSGSPP